MNKCLSFICLKQPTHLDKSKKKLQQIPKDIGRYEKSLQELDIQHNAISTIDKSLFRCRKLERLYLNDNCLIEIPDEIGDLVNLQELYLNRNEIQEISDNIRNCEKLLYLDISSNHLQRLPDGVTMLRNLQILIMNEISTNNLPSTISSLCNLRILEARDNLIQSVPESISFLSKLTRMDLGCNEISSLPETIGQLECLSELWLDTNILTQLPAEIAELHNLEILELSNNPIQHLTDQICNLENLTDLTLTSNPLTELPENLGNLKSLKIFKVDYNQLKNLPDSICNLSNLTELFISGNCLTCLPLNIGQLKQLKILHADYNSIKTLPDSICSCEELTIFSLRDNLLEILPQNMGDLTKLGVLDICGNKLKYLPFSIHKLKKIKALWLSKTQQKSMYPLQVEDNSLVGKVLTNFLLPQIPDSDKSRSNLSLESTDINKTTLIVPVPASQPIISETPTESNISKLSMEKPKISKSLQDMSDQLNVKEMENGVKCASSIKFSTKHQSLDEDHDLDDFSLNVINLQCKQENHGIVLNTNQSFNEPVFASSESCITITNILKNSPAYSCKHLRIGDRILSINLIPMQMVTPSEAEALLNLHKDNLELLVRHEPNISHFKTVKLVRSSSNQKLGLRVKRRHRAKSLERDVGYIPLIEILEISPNTLADENKNIKIGSFIVEVNGYSMLNMSREDFTKFVASSDKEINLVLYDKRWKQNS